MATTQAKPKRLPGAKRANEFGVRELTVNEEECICHRLVVENEGAADERFIAEVRINLYLKDGTCVGTVVDEVLLERQP